jgi:hypothetical protein
MLDARGYPAVVRLVRTLLVFKLGFWAGTFASASLLKRAFPSRGDADSDELGLVAILVTGFSAFDGIAVGAEPIES